MTNGRKMPAILESMALLLRRYMQKERADPKKMGRSLRFYFLYLPFGTILTIVLLVECVIRTDSWYPCSRYIVSFNNQSKEAVTDILLTASRDTLWEGKLRPGEERMITLEMDWYPQFQLTAKQGEKMLSAIANKGGIETDAAITFAFTDERLSVEQRWIKKTKKREVKEHRLLIYPVCPERRGEKP